MSLTCLLNKNGSRSHSGVNNGVSTSPWGLAPYFLTFPWHVFPGDICSVTVLGQPIIVLNSVKAAFDILDKKSPIYSDRPILQMGGNLVGWKNTLVLLPYGDRFRRFRRLFHGVIGNRATMKQFLPIEEIETHRFLRRVLAKPNDIAGHIRQYAYILSV